MADQSRPAPGEPGGPQPAQPAPPAPAVGEASGLANSHIGGLTPDDRGLYKLLVESVRDYAIFALDREGHIISWNLGAQRIKGYTAEEIIGKHFSIFYPAEDLAWGKPPWELDIAVRQGRFEEEGWRIRKDGSRFWANVVITALRDATGEVVGFAKVTRDLTERRAAEARALADARRVAVAEEANRVKAQFLAAMSHELRTPLNAIGGYVDLLAMGLRGPITTEQSEDFDRIRRAQRHLLGIINDLLNFSRVEAGQLTYEIAQVRLVDVIDSVAPMIAPQATAKGLHFERRNCDGSSVARADRAKLEQILLNLLSNAVKFTDADGTITVSCDGGDGEVRLCVTDTGIGIAPDQLEQIFEPFVQVGRSLTSMHEGTGLGLAISRDLARGMGGDITVRSNPATGSSFTLTLPSSPNRTDATRAPVA